MSRAVKKRGVCYAAGIKTEIQRVLWRRSGGMYLFTGKSESDWEHTDYNGGHVFPCALTIGTYMLARKREDRTLRFFSVNFEKAGVFVTSLDELTWKRKIAGPIIPKELYGRFSRKDLKSIMGWTF